MSEPRRLLEDPGETELTRALLRSAQDDAPPPEARKKTLVALGLGGAVLGAGTTVTTTTAAAVGGAGLAKWFGVGVVTGLLMLGGAQLMEPRSAPAPSRAVAAAQTAEGGRGEAREAPAEPTQGVERAARAAEEGQHVAAGAPFAAAGAPGAAAGAPGAAARPVPALRDAAAAVSRSASADRNAPSPLAATPQGVGRASIRQLEPGAAAAAGALPAQPTLIEEVAVLDRAREAISAGDAQRAFSALEKHEGQFAGGLLGPEAEVLRIEATALRGQRAEALRLAQAFLAKHPDSPLVGRVRKVVSAVPATPAPAASAGAP